MCGVDLEGTCETIEPALGVTTMAKMPILTTKPLSAVQMDDRHNYSQVVYSPQMSRSRLDHHPAQDFIHDLITTGLAIDPRAQNLSTDDYVQIANFQDICRYSEAAADVIQDDLARFKTQIPTLLLWSSALVPPSSACTARWIMISLCYLNA